MVQNNTWNPVWFFWIWVIFLPVRFFPPVCLLVLRKCSSLYGHSILYDYLVLKSKPELCHRKVSKVLNVLRLHLSMERTKKKESSFSQTKRKDPENLKWVNKLLQAPDFFHCFAPRLFTSFITFSWNSIAHFFALQRTKW